MTSRLLLGFGDLLRQIGRSSGRAAWAVDLRELPRALRWVLPWTVLGRLSRDANPCRWLERHARSRALEIALVDENDRISFEELYEATRGVAASMSRAGVQSGERVALLEGTNATLVKQLFACWFLGAIPCPMDPSMPESWLNEILERLAPAWLSHGTSLVDAKLLGGAKPLCLDEGAAGERPDIGLRVRWPAAETAMILATSGTEGRMKLCRLSAGRLALSGHAFGSLALGCRRGDVIHCPLPLQHATGVAVALMPALVHGVTLSLGGRFSASHFMEYVSTNNITQVVYVGDLWRYVLAATPPGTGAKHRVRVTVGNGLDEVTWRLVQQQLAVPRIVEFYGASEAPSVLLNFAGRAGSIGRVPFRRLSRYVVVREAGECDADEREASGSVPAGDRQQQRGGQVRWKECDTEEPGELWIRLPRTQRPWLGGFEGYLDPRENERAVVENAFRQGDRYYRTRDWVRFDDDDYFYFLDRLGDVWRNKGHNVSMSWLARALQEADGVEDACVWPVALDESARRFGLAIAVTRGADGLAALERRLRELPNYARPQIVQQVTELRKTRTFKVRRGPLGSLPWKPDDSGGACYVWCDGLQPVQADQWESERLRIIDS